MMSAMTWCAYRMMGYCYGALMEVVAEDLEQNGLTELEGLIFRVEHCQIDLLAGLPLDFLGRAQFRWIVDKWHDLLAAIVGNYCLTLDTRQQKILMMVGPKRSGKGTIARVLRRLIGERNVAGPTLSSLSGDFGLQPLLGKSVAIIGDARLNGRDNSAQIERLLSISGEDSLSVGRKNMTAVESKLDTRLMLLSNELPRFSDVSGALASRMIILRLTRSWFGMEDAGLFARLIPELPGILLWAIQGWQRLRHRGHFEVPESSREVQEELNDLTSPVGAFVRQCCDEGPGLQVPRNELYQAYQRWCQSEGMLHFPNRVVFGRDLRTAVATVRNSQQHGGIRVYLGIGLKPATGPQQDAGGSSCCGTCCGAADPVAGLPSGTLRRVRGRLPQQDATGCNMIRNRMKTASDPVIYGSATLCNRM